MNVAQYLFQSPTTSQVQVGRLDPSSVEKETKSETDTDTESKVEVDTSTKDLKTEEVEPLRVSNPVNILDLYV